MRLRGESQRRFKKIYRAFWGGFLCIVGVYVCMYVSQLLACLFSICVVFPCSLDLQNWVGFSPIASKSVFSGSGPFELEMITASGLSSQHFPIAFIDGVFVADSSLYLSLHPSISLPCFLLLENLTLWVVLLFNLLHYCHQERFFSTRERSGFFLFFATQQWVGVFLICQKKNARLQ
jgi:hypothetical protein